MNALSGVRGSSGVNKPLGSTSLCASDCMHCRQRFICESSWMSRHLIKLSFWVRIGVGTCVESKYVTQGEPRHTAPLPISPLNTVC